MNRVLIIAYHYPPSSAVGGIRPSKWARYFPDFGWQPVVLTADTADSEGSGGGRTEAGVLRVREWPHPLKTFESFRMRRAVNRGNLGRLSAKWSVPCALAFAPPQQRGFAALKRWLLAFLRLPDQELGWLVPATWRAMRLIRVHRVTQVITSGPPWTCHLIGLALKALTGIRWVADFRDPWSMRQKLPIFRNGPTDLIEHRLIRSVLERADLVVSYTPSVTEQFKKDHPAIDPEKFVTVRSGFDASDFGGYVAPSLPPRPVVFSYIGAFYPGQSPEAFLRAMRSLLDDGSIEPGAVRVRLIGHVAVADGKLVSDLVDELGLRDIVTLRQPVGRPEALRLNLATHVALVFTAQYPLSSKLYEALACGSLVLNLGHGGDTADLLQKTGRGISVDPSSHEEIRAGIMEAMKRSQRLIAQRRADPWQDPGIQCFSVRESTRQVAGLIDTLAVSR